MVDNRCAWSTNGQELQFKELAIGEHSSVIGYSRTGKLGITEDAGATIIVETVTLNTLLTEYKYPNYVEFFSIDVEGAEWEILKDFDFSQVTFGFIAVEPTSNIPDIHSLLSMQGHVRVLEEKSRWDGWYIPKAEAIKFC